MNNYPDVSLHESLLDRNQSSAIKGCLMLFIILGHNMFFTMVSEPYQLMGLLYCFHIQSFFLLSYLYPVKPLSKQRILDHSAKCLIPYVWCFFILFFAGFLTHRHRDLYRLPLALVSGNPLLLKEFTGIQVLWFLPAFFWTCCLKELSAYRKFKKSLLILSGVVWIFPLFELILPQAVNQMWRQLQITAFSLLTGMQYLLPGFLLRKILRHNLCKVKFALAGFVSGGVLYFVDCFVWAYPVWNYHYMTPLGYLITCVMPIFFFVLLFALKYRLAKIEWLRKFGNHTMIVYLIHPFIGYALYRVLYRPEQIWYQIIMIIPSCFVMIFGSYAVSLLLNRLPGVKRCFLPGSWGEAIGGSGSVNR